MFFLFKVFSNSFVGLTEEYQDKVEGVTESMDSRLKDQDALSIKSSLDDILPMILIVLLFVVLFNFVIPVGQKLHLWVTWANYLVIAYFSVRLIVEYRLASSHEKFFHEHLFDFLMIVPAVSILEEVKLFQAARDYEIVEQTPGFLTGASLPTLGISARLGKIFRIIKRSIGL